MSANQAIAPVATMGRVLGVSESGCDAWRKRAPSPRAQRDVILPGVSKRRGPAWRCRRSRDARTRLRNARRQPTSRPTPYHPVRPDDPTPLAQLKRVRSTPFNKRLRSTQATHRCEDRLSPCAATCARRSASRRTASSLQSALKIRRGRLVDVAAAVDSHGRPAADIRDEQAPAPARRSTGLQPTRSIRRDDDVRAWPDQ